MQEREKKKTKRKTPKRRNLRFTVPSQHPPPKKILNFLLFWYASFSHSVLQAGAGAIDCRREMSVGSRVVIPPPYYPLRETFK